MTERGVGVAAPNQGRDKINKINNRTNNSNNKIKIQQDNNSICTSIGKILNQNSQGNLMKMEKHIYFIQMIG